MKAKEREKQQAPRIEHGDPQVVLHPEDNDLFMRTGKQVINACRLDISVELWMEEFNAMVIEVEAWAQEHSSKVRSCYCTPRGSGIAFFFSPATDSFDFDLADELADLNRALPNRYNVGTVEVQQIPWNQAMRFLHPDRARWVYGQRLERTSTPMEA